MLGEKRVIDGQRRRRCDGCGKWFHAGWAQYHGCRGPGPGAAPGGGAEAAGAGSGGAAGTAE